MTSLHTTSDASRFIGALEFGSTHGDVDDSALEAAVKTAAPQTVNPIMMGCHHIEDGALEDAAKITAAGPTQMVHPATHRCM